MMQDMELMVKSSTRRCGVVFANALVERIESLQYPRWSEHTLNVAKKFGLPVANSEQFVAELVDGTPRINEDTMRGISECSGWKSC